MGFCLLPFSIGPKIMISILWPTLLFSATAAASSICRSRLRCEAQIGLCPFCHYDIRATPETCPECGHPQRKQKGRKQKGSEGNKKGRKPIDKLDGVIIACSSMARKPRRCPGGLAYHVMNPSYRQGAHL